MSVSVRWTFPVASSLLFALLLSGQLTAADWPGWRGPTGQGIADERNLPLTWGGKDATNVLWKFPLPGTASKAHQDQNQSSPIVQGGRVYLTASYWPVGRKTKEYPEHHVVCLRAADGKRLWDTTIAPGPWLLSDLRGGYTAPTPAADAERVYVLFGSAVLAALDRDGKLVWRQEITPHDYDVAIGNSPVLFEGTVLLMCDQMAQKKSSRLLAFDAKSGRLKWEKKRPAADWTHSTPVVVPIKGRALLLVAGAGGLEGLDPRSGDTLWKGGLPGGARTGDTVSPVYGGGMVYVDSGRGGPGLAVDPTGQGDVSKTHIKWKIGQVSEGFSSPVVFGGRLYRLHRPDRLTCRDLTTGQEVYSERLPGLSVTVSPFVTPEGGLWCVSAGKSYVVKAGPKLVVLGTSDLGDPSEASPAVADGRLFLKGRRFLYCIGKR
jgi:outer membrane protein assembly factor BamB